MDEGMDLREADPGIDGMILKWILKKQDGRTWNEFIWFMIKKSGGLL